jgi:hypothetical protein
VEYTDSISDDTYKVNAGISVAFDDITDFSTYRAPSNIKTHLSELNRFENIVLAQNMALASSAGVQKTQAAIDRDAISSPTISLADQTVDDNGGGQATDLPAPTVSDVQSGAVYSIVNNTVTGLTINSSTGVMTYDNDINPSNSFNVTIKVTNPDGGSDTATFTLNINDNL